MTTQVETKLSLPALTAMVVGSMVGAGIFSLPRNFARATGPAGAIIAWCVAGIGMYALARVFQALAERRPELDAGVFAYARAGFGDYAGFLSAFGYWMAGCFGNVSYWVLIKSTLGAFVPAFGNGNTAIAIIVSSLGIWLFHLVMLRGVQQATMINTIVTVAKVIPIVLFIGILIVLCRADMFRANLWEGHGELGAGLFSQVRATMLVTVFVFVGIEGASVYSRYARKRADVGTATVSGFAAVLCLLVLVTLLPYATLPRADIALMRQPSMAAVLGALLGPFGVVFVSVGLIVSILGAYLAWSLICAEVLFAAARMETMPRIFSRQNERKLPVAAIWLTSSVVQMFVISTYWSTDAFALMLNLTSSMALIPYFLVAAYGIKAARHDREHSEQHGDRALSRVLRREYFIAAFATLYTAFLLFAGGAKFLMLSALLYAPGSVLYVLAKRERGQRVFSKAEWVIFAVAVCGAVGALVGLVSGGIVI
ncbi:MULTISPECIES: basic amino acid/polyamine antiporter [Burkholderiaceae]|uniref:basic amino acid/polyamine antiporter n=1 Tax=Burkholderiaceae TaxID=119060 RepID=UPI0014243992|nr:MULTISPECIES: basic amino acid/polyamine antiporter [Burkholderiaceae]MBN3846825.1 amino acid permease [Paraburkholderia sp. Ac-20342]NIF51168.1 amino acid permease [Burkholderia sp. Ax-1724]